MSKKTSDETIASMRAARARGDRVVDIANAHGVSVATVSGYAGMRSLRDENARLQEENEALRAALEAAGVA